jgi:hypothetical protein
MLVEQNYKWRKKEEGKKERNAKKRKKREKEREKREKINQIFRLFSSTLIVFLLSAAFNTSIPLHCKAPVYRLHPLLLASIVTVVRGGSTHSKLESPCTMDP